jgi:hypothetical protein
MRGAGCVRLRASAACHAAGSPCTHLLAGCSSRGLPLGLLLPVAMSNEHVMSGVAWEAAWAVLVQDLVQYLRCCLFCFCRFFFSFRLSTLDCLLLLSEPTPFCAGGAADGGSSAAMGQPAQSALWWSGAAA